VVSACQVLSTSPAQVSQQLPGALQEVAEVYMAHALAHHCMPANRLQKAGGLFSSAVQLELAPLVVSHVEYASIVQWDQRGCRVPYIMSLLKRGLSISEDKVQVGTGREGWTLGAALAEGGRVGIGRPILEQVRAAINQLQQSATCVLSSGSRVGS